MANTDTKYDRQVENKVKLKIVFVQHSLPRAGGAEQVLHDLIMRLNRDAFEPVLCCLYELGEFGEALERAGCRTYQHVALGRRDPRNTMRLAKILKKERADILYVTNSFNNMVVGRLAAWLAGIQTVLSFHSYDTIQRQHMPRVRSLMLATANRLLNPTFHRAVALAESHKQYLMSTRRIPAEKISVIHNGIDLDRFTLGPSSSEARRRFDLPEGAHLVGIVAALRRVKDHQMFLKAAAKVRLDMPDTVFVIAGEGPERPNLERMAEELGMDNHVRFLGQVDDVPTLLRAFDVSVLSSFTEAFPLTLLESMAVGRPVVTTDVGSVGEIVEEGVDGFRVPSGDADAFAGRILKILRHPELAKQFGDAGRRKVEEMFTVDRMVRQTETLLQEMVGPASGKALQQFSSKDDDPIQVHCPQ